jgi:Ser/Thr protein kinase RdoA (MazF antagonist)
MGQELTLGDTQSRISREEFAGIMPSEELQAWLSQALGNEAPQEAIQIIERRVIKRRLSDWRGSRCFEKVAVCGPAGMVFPLFLKYFYREVDVEPHDLRVSPEREAQVYKEVLRDASLGAARFYGFRRLGSEDSVALLLEFVAGTRLSSHNVKQSWLAVARWLAHMHHHFSRSQDHLKALGLLLHYDADFYWSWAYRAVELAMKVSREAGAISKGMLGRYERVAGPLGSAAPTFIHGEFYCSNVLIQEDREKFRICAFDWETAGIGCGAIDLTYLLRQRWGIDEHSLIQAYLDGWREKGEFPSWLSDIHSYIRRCRIHEVMYSLGAALNRPNVAAAKVIKYIARAKEYMKEL